MSDAACFNACLYPPWLRTDDFRLPAMAVPLSYSVRNLWTRKLTTLLTAGGMALVVFVYAAVLMLDAGLKKTLVGTGEPDNIVVTRRPSGTEVQSRVDRSQVAIVESQPEIAAGPTGDKFVSRELVVLIALPKRGSDLATNVPIRGIGPQGLALRSQIKVVAGRLPRAGVAEVMVGSSVAKRFDGAELGERLRFGGRDWTVVGVFDGGGSGFDSEIWGDGDQLMQAFRRDAYSSVVARIADVRSFAALKERLESDPRLTLEVKPERLFYEEQSRALSNFISYLGLTLSVIFSLGATIGAMITMYAAVANRTREIGTLRALGFRRNGILGAFLAESLALALVGWLIGLALASLMQLVQISTVNFQSFSELAFRFTLTPKIVLQSLAFALAMGLLGGFLPALRAARMKIVDSLRAA
jgi:ABC-type antimicrobial peptide transport system permease subunit